MGWRNFSADFSGRHDLDHAGNGLRVPPGKVTYVYGHLPVFQYAHEDVAGFRYFTSQLVVHGTVGQADLAPAFHVPKVIIKRSVKRFREGSGNDFFTRPRRRSAPFGLIVLGFDGTILVAPGEQREIRPYKSLSKTSTQ
jgi:hypothetical protein